MFIFAIYTFLVFTWMSLLKYSMNTPQNPFSRVRVPFFLVNVFNLVYVAVTIYLISPSTPDNTRVIVVEVGGVVMGSLAILTAASVIFYGMSLYRFMESAGGKKLSGSKKKTSASSSAERMKYAAYGFSLALIGEGALWLETSIDIQTFFNNELVLGSVFYSMSVISMSIMLFLFKNGVTALDPKTTLTKQKSSTLLNKTGSDRLLTRQESARSMRRAASRSDARTRVTDSVSGRTRGATEEMSTAGGTSPPSIKSTLDAPLNTDDEFEQPKRRDSEEVQDIVHTHREVDALMSLGADLDALHEEEPEFQEPVNIELENVLANPAQATSSAVTSMVAPEGSPPTSAAVSPIQSTSNLLSNKVVDSSSMISVENEPVQDVPALSIK